MSHRCVRMFVELTSSRTLQVFVDILSIVVTGIGIVLSLTHR